MLQKTDIAERAVDELSRSRIKRVKLIGRRGPLQVAFTIAELRELIKMPGVLAKLDPLHYAELCAGGQIKGQPSLPPSLPPSLSSSLPPSLSHLSPTPSPQIYLASVNGSQS